MAYALKNIALFKINCSNPDQTCQIYIELVLCRYQHRKCNILTNSGRKKVIEKQERFCAISTSFLSRICIVLSIQLQFTLTLGLPHCRHAARQKCCIFIYIFKVAVEGKAISSHKFSPRVKLTQIVSETIFKWFLPQF